VSYSGSTYFIYFFLLLNRGKIRISIKQLPHLYRYVGGTEAFEEKAESVFTVGEG